MIRIGRKPKAVDVIDVPSELFILRGVPGHVRSDNGPEFVAKAGRERIAAVVQIAIPHDATVCKLRNRIERCFRRLKHFRRFATRYDRRTIHFAGFLHLAAAMIRLR